MNAPRSKTTPSLRYWTGPVVAWSLLGSCALLLCWAGCATPHERYKTLSFFFDGVPDPDAPVSTQPDTSMRTARSGSGATLTVYTHKPFAENKCANCHGSSRGNFESFSRADPHVCRSCHENTAHQYPVMHGPVVNNECLWCHEPHESTVPHLLKDRAPALCLQCHSRKDLPIRPVEHQDPKLDCLICHVGHGGVRHGLLRAGAPVWGLPTTTSPTTAPAPPPPVTAPTSAPTSFPEKEGA
jgi:predicted CXXCH cytochrome family protein